MSFHYVLLTCDLSTMSWYDTAAQTGRDTSAHRKFVVGENIRPQPDYPHPLPATSTTPIDFFIHGLGNACISLHHFCHNRLYSLAVRAAERGGNWREAVALYREAGMIVDCPPSSSTARVVFQACYNGKQVRTLQVRQQDDISSAVFMI